MNDVVNLFNIIEIFNKIIFLLFLPFYALAQKNVEKVYFDQGLECAACKSWSKYTTVVTSMTHLKPFLV